MDSSGSLSGTDDEVQPLMAHAHCMGPGPRMMGFYIMLCTVHTTQGQGHGTIVTVRNEVAKVMFLQVPVCPRGGGGYPSMPCRWYPIMPCSRSPGGGCLLLGGGCLLWGWCLLRGGVDGDTPASADGYCCRRYASYWNAFLFSIVPVPVPVLVPVPCTAYEP